MHLKCAYISYIYVHSYLIIILLLLIMNIIILEKIIAMDIKEAKLVLNLNITID
jgi:hypothetical protein